MIGTRAEWQKYRIALMAMLLAGACFLTYYFHVVLEAGTVFTHSFYIPIILASFWWGRKGLVVAVFLAALLILSHLFLRPDVMTANDYSRAALFVVVAFAVGMLSDRRKRAESRVEHLNAVLRAIRNINHLIAVERDRDRLLKGACENLIETRGYYNAWIVLLDGSGNFVASAEAGLGKYFAPMVEQMKHGELTNCARRALAHSDVVVTEDPFLTCSDCPLAKMYGGRGAMSVRLERNGKLYGLVSTSIPAEFTTDDEERSLFKEVAGDIALALHVMEQDEEHKWATEALKESENRYRDLFNSASDAILIRDLEGNILEVNQAASELTGYTVDELVKTNIRQFLTAESFEIAMKKQRRQLEGEATSQRYELEMVRKDGTRAVIEAMISIINENEQPVAIQATVRDVTEERKMRDSTRFYLHQVTIAQEEERKRIARELHDDTAQELVALSRRLDKLSATSTKLSRRDSTLLEEAQQDVDRILEGVRRFSRDLRPSILDDLGLLPALEWLASELTKQFDIAIATAVVGTERRFSPEAELVMFRIAQEALRNTCRHAQASRASVAMEYGEDKTIIRVSDNGKGFELPERLSDLASLGKLGLAGMEERARLLGGTLSLQSAPGKGTTVTIEVPI